MQMIDVISPAGRLVVPIHLLAMLLLATPAAADCDATVSLVDFGRLDLEQGGDITGELIVSCDQPSEFNVSISPGIGDFVRRKMRGEDGAELIYNLFVDPARRSIWGDGVTAGTQAITGENDGRRPSIIPIYGIVPSRQNTIAGPYRDNLLVTIDQS